MDKADKADKMNKTNKIDRTNEWFRNFKLKSMDDRKYILFVVFLAILSVCLQDQALWNGLRHQVNIIFPGLAPFLPPRPPQYPKPDQKLDSKPDPIIQFANGTTALYMELSVAEIPAPGIVTKHVDKCIELANMLERCKVHQDVARLAANHLNALSNVLYDAGDALREMFVESASVHQTFNIEVNAMIKKFERFLGQIINDPNYFKLRMMKLEITIGKFEKIVDNAIKAIIMAQSRREEVHGALLDFKMVAENYEVDTHRTKNFDLTKESIKEVDDMMVHLTDMAGGLRGIRGKLKDYELQMKKVGGNLNEISHEALQHLKAAVERWEEYHNKFINKQKLHVILH